MKSFTASLKRSLCLSAIALGSIFQCAFAGTPVLGFEVGVSTFEQVNAGLAKKTRVENTGVNKFSNGPMLKTDGSAYEIDGLTEVLYIFDEQKKLMGVVMDMNKSRFDAIYQFLAPKYKLSEQQRPFVGNQFARFRTADSTIELDAPHMSFEMSVRYMRNDLVQKFKAQSQAEAAAKKKSESSKF